MKTIRYQRSAGRPGPQRSRLHTGPAESLGALFTFEPAAGQDGPWSVHGPRSGFTMIEIAICLAVIGFALAAIVGVLPIGLSVQRENREETVISQDASVLINSIRNGELGLDDLTNYVMAITNYSYDYNNNGKPVAQTYGYTRTTSTHNGSAMSPLFPLTSGFRIIGLLSTPRYADVFVTPRGSSFRSNYVVAYFRALSGDASQTVPQTNSEVQALAFSYRLISDIVPYADFDRNWTNYLDPNITGNTNEITLRSNYWMIAKTMQTNLHDLRLIFRYPLLPTGNAGNGRLVYRTTVSGQLRQTNEFGFPASPPYELFFFQPRTYVRAQ